MSDVLVETLTVTHITEHLVTPAWFQLILAQLDIRSVH